MIRPTLSALVILLASVAATRAACPPQVSGDTPEAIRANAERIICLQNELAAATREREFELRLDTLEQTQHNLQIQQRINALPDVPVFQPP